jgi:predicted site-specific integrase-resolvase
MDKMIKIKLAAEQIGVAEKTVYNWIESGILRLAHPGYVFVADLDGVVEKAKEEQKRKSKLRSVSFTRDQRGRFRLLSGGLNGKGEKKIL